MGTDVSWMIELSVNSGSEEDLRALINDAVTATRNEPRTLAYEWSLSPDGSICHIYERYADSAAVMEHLAAFRAKFADRFMKLVKPVRITMYGSPSQELKDALAALNPLFMRPVAGFHR